jgi:hypothetical protein
MSGRRTLPTLEEKLAPRDDGLAPQRDVPVVGLLVLLALVLVPGWAGREYTRRMLLSSEMLLALAFLLALRWGAVDLSVWMVSDLAAALATWLLGHGYPADVAIAASLLTGAAVGALNGLVVARLRGPAPLVTLVTAVVVMFGLRAAVGHGGLSLPDANAPRLLTPFDPTMSAALLAYVLVLLVLMVLSVSRVGRDIGRRWGLALALTASGLVSAAGGICWLVDHSSAPVASVPIGELRVPAAAVLAGGALLAGPRRAVLSVLCLLPALLVATVWRQQAAAAWAGGYFLHVGGLLVMAVGCHVMLKSALTPSARWTAWLWALMAVGGLLLVALTARSDVPGERTLLAAAGGGVFLAAVAGGAASRVASRKSSPL